jgi:hypothetical protein
MDGVNYFLPRSDMFLVPDARGIRPLSSNKCQNNGTGGIEYNPQTLDEQ